jgi:predicted TIM-barrel fold metal-dependent hydrolase
VLLPGAPPGSGLPPLFDPGYYEPLWAVCDELGMPLNHHSGSAAPATGEGPEDHVILVLEVTWWAHRAFTHLLVSGAFERHPGLRLVLTEQGTAWIPDELMRLDYFFDRFRNAKGSQEAEWGLPVIERMSLTPSEYFARQCSVGSSFIRPDEVKIRHTVGLDKIMWGSDYPHKEGTQPFTLEALRASFAGVDHDEVQAMVGDNAARTYGFDRDALRAVADEIGPAVADVDLPLPARSLPPEAEKCPALVGFGRRP